MKICVVNAQAPFIRGGAEVLADNLAAKLRERGHVVEIVGIPFRWYPPAAVAPQMLACRLFRLDSGEPDLVIGLKFPAYLAPFPRKKVWLLHQFRQAYDLWDSPLRDPALATAQGRWLRELIRRADDQHLRGLNGLYTISRNVAGRLKKYNDIDADEVLYPPLERPELFRPGEQGDYFFYPSRLGPLKRQTVAIEAMRFVRSPFRLVLAGAPDADGHLEELQALIHRHRLEDRVRLLGRVSETDKIAWLADCLAVVFLPVDEDYGYVTVEAFQAQKPVLTFRDSGGPTEIVRDGDNGLVLEPTPEALAEAMERLWADRARARCMGEAGPARLRELGIDWPHVLERLVA